LDIEHPVISGDVSMRLYEQLASAAWVIEDDDLDKRQILTCILLQNISSISCYRAELENVSCSLYHIEQTRITPKEVGQCCNNKQAILNSSKPLSTPKQTLQVDVDVLLATHHLKKCFLPKCNVNMHMCIRISGYGERRVDMNRRRKKAWS